MKRKSLLILGCGDIGTRVGTTLLAEGWLIHGARRNVHALPGEFSAHRADYAAPGGLGGLREIRPDAVLATFNPLDRSVAGYRAGFLEGARNLLDFLGDHRPERIVFVSSTRVFAESGGGWVDEGSALATEDERAVLIADAERALLDSGQKVSIIRFSGIYGNPGGHLIARVTRGDISPAEPATWGNRIHRDDCAGFICHLLRAARAGGELEPVYIGTDDEPALRHEVEVWLAREMGLQAAVEEGTRPEGAAGGKRCRNRLLHASGYRLRFPDYRSGYRAVLADSSD